MSENPHGSEEKVINIDIDQDIEEGESPAADEPLTCSSAVLAAQLKKVAPDLIFTNSPSSIEIASEKSLEDYLKRKVSSKRTLLSDSGIEKKLSGSVSKKVSFRKVQIPSDIAAEQLLSVDEDIETIDESTLRSYPIPIEEKRRRRSSIQIVPQQISWKQMLQEAYDSVLKFLRQNQIWNEHLKKIEGRFGASVLSYFLFIRWLLIMNIVIMLLNLFFLVLPPFITKTSDEEVHTNMTFNETMEANFSLTEVLRTNIICDVLCNEDLSVIFLNPVVTFNPIMNINELVNEDDITYEDIFPKAAFQKLTDTRSVFQSFLTSNYSNGSIDLIAFCHHRYHSKISSMTFSGFFASLQDLLQGTGWMERTLMFVGSYPMENVTYFGHGYNMALAFIWVFIMAYVISLVMMIDYSSVGIKEAFITRKQVHSFSNQVFCGWDYCIRNEKSSNLHHDRFIVELKSNLSEIRHRKEISERSASTWVKLYAVRILVNIIVVFVVIACYALIYNVTVFQLKQLKTKQLDEAGLRTLIIQFLPSFAVVLIESLSPSVFAYLVSFENYGAEQKVNISVIRNTFTCLSSIIVLVSTIHRQITCEPRDICGAGKSTHCRTPSCWETFVGQQLYKLKIFEIAFIVGMFLCVELPQDYFARNYDNKLTRLVGRGEFLLPIEVLAPIYSQTVLWLGILFCPLLSVMTVLQIVSLFYIKKAKVLKFSEPSKDLYKASKFNAVFINTLLLAFLAVFTSCSYALVNIRPSLGCSPFRGYNAMIEAFTKSFTFLPLDLVTIWNFFISGWFFIPVSALMVAIIYYYWKYIAFLKNLEDSLKADLVLISQDKQFLLKKIGDLSSKKAN